MSFRKMRGVELPYIKQGLIYFTCQNYYSQPETVQHKINNLCLTCGGEYYQALFEVVTTQKSITQIAMKHYVCEMTVYRMRNRFYEAW